MAQNLDLYKRVSDFKEKVATDNHLNSKIKDIHVKCDLLGENLTSVEASLKSQLAVRDSSLAEQLSVLRQEMQDNYVLADQLSALRKEIQDNFVTSSELHQYSQNVEMTLNDFVLSGTPRDGASVVEDVKKQLKDLHDRVSILFEKHDKLAKDFKKSNDEDNMRESNSTTDEQIRSKQVPSLRLVKKK